MFIISEKGLITLFTTYKFLLAISYEHKSDYNQGRKQILDWQDKVLADGGKAKGDEMQFNALLKSGLKQLKAKQPLLVLPGQERKY